MEFDKSARYLYRIAGLCACHRHKPTMPRSKNFLRKVIWVSINALHVECLIYFQVSHSWISLLYLKQKWKKLEVSSEHNKLLSYVVYFVDMSCVMTVRTCLCWLSVCSDNIGSNFHRISNVIFYHSYFVDVRSARTAIGHDKDGKVVFVQLDGQTGVRGASLKGFAK